MSLAMVDDTGIEPVTPTMSMVGELFVSVFLCFQVLDSERNESLLNSLSL